MISLACCEGELWIFCDHLVSKAQEERLLVVEEVPWCDKMGVCCFQQSTTSSIAITQRDLSHAQ